MSLEREFSDRKITSSRPAWPLIDGIMSDNKRYVLNFFDNLFMLTSCCRLLLMPYHETWRNIRKIMHQLLTPKQCEAYRPAQDTESKQLLWDYLHDPDRYSTRISC